MLLRFHRFDANNRQDGGKNIDQVAVRKMIPREPVAVTEAGQEIKSGRLHHPDNVSYENISILGEYVMKTAKIEDEVEDVILKGQLG